MKLFQPSTESVRPLSEWSYVEKAQLSTDRIYDNRVDQDITHYITEPSAIDTMPGFFSTWQIDGGIMVMLHRDQIVYKPFPQESES